VKRICSWLALATMATLGASAAHGSSEDTKKLQDDAKASQVEDGEEAELAWPELQVCERYLGAWKLVEHHYNAEGKVVATVEGAEEVTWIVGNRAIQRRYISGARKALYRAVGTLTWNKVEGKYHGVWFDSASDDGPRTVKGNWDEKSQTLTFIMEVKGKDGPPTTHKIVEKFVNEQRRVTTTFRVDGDKTVKLLEIDADRISHCPTGVKMFFGG